MCNDNRGSITIEALLVCVMLMVFAISLFSAGEIMIIKSQTQTALDNTAILLSSSNEKLTDKNLEDKIETTMKIFCEPETDMSFKGSKIEDGKLTIVCTYSFDGIDLIGMIRPVKITQKSVTMLW